jgi:hypothetical protein
MERVKLNTVEEVVVEIGDVKTKGHVWWASHVAQAQQNLADDHGGYPAS